MVWAYMGPETADLPPLPNVEWNLVPAENVQVSMRVQECNWLQALEGETRAAAEEYVRRAPRHSQLSFSSVPLGQASRVSPGSIFP